MGLQEKLDEKFSNERFSVKELGKIMPMKLITDKETGVQYLASGGITVLVDRDGKPLIDKNYK